MLNSCGPMRISFQGSPTQRRALWKSWDSNAKAGRDGSLLLARLREWSEQGNRPNVGRIPAAFYRDWAARIFRSGSRPTRWARNRAAPELHAHLSLQHRYADRSRTPTALAL